MNAIDHLIARLREEAYYTSTPEPTARLLNEAADALAEHVAHTS